MAGGAVPNIADAQLPMSRMRVTFFAIGRCGISGGGGGGGSRFGGGGVFSVSAHSTDG